jgi:hypothetical protein
MPPCMPHHQGVPYLLLDPSKEVADARLWRCPLTGRGAEILRRLTLYGALRQPLREGAAALLQGGWRQWARARQSEEGEEQQRVAAEA